MRTRQKKFLVESRNSDHSSAMTSTDITSGGPTNKSCSAKN
jgi:hypothetical protein